MKPKVGPFFAVVAIGLCASALAADGTRGIEESTDPARAAAVERTAAEMKARAAQAASSGPAPAVPVRGRTDSGVSFLSGGISVDEQTSMYAERGRYNLWVVTVARPSGAYLADARLRIVDLKDRRTLLERTMEGPWLFAALPAGRYEVSADLRADGQDRNQTLSTRVRVPEAGQRQVVLRFEANVQVGPDEEGPFKGNPFGEPAKPK
jgi:hypothetical protein